MVRVVVPGYVRDVMRVLIGGGFEAFVVGGAVRDSVLGVEPSDWDVATNARPGTVIELFSRAGWRVVPKGVRYGVVSVVHPVVRREVEIATYRREVYVRPGDRRSLVASFSDSLYDDVARRDFTINALAADIDGNVIDYVGGLEDLRRGVIQFVGRPEERIREDPLRMIRALRFAAKLGFVIDEAGFDAIKRMAGMVRFLSRERIGEEVVKAARTPRFALFAELLYESNLYKYIIPEYDDMASVRHPVTKWHYGETVLVHTFDTLRRADEAGLDWRVKLALLLHDTGKPYVFRETGGFVGHEKVSAEIAKEFVLERLRLSWKVADIVVGIVRSHMWPLHVATNLGIDVLAEKSIAKYGELAPLILEHAYADTGDKSFLEQARKARKLLSVPKPLLNGHDIMEIYGLRPGPEVGRLKRVLYEIQLRYGLTQKADVVRKAAELGIRPKKRVDEEKVPA